ncbi:hypothetical protein WJX74_003470 [Apatococcus lobatus]|uniref:Uncharacterized protein n=1 Tax=Apatococcus lobatus TaxID=904363 RepID=A0AAW1SE10_9CHLO
MGLLSDSNGTAGPGASLNTACAALSQLTTTLSLAQQRSTEALQDTKAVSLSTRKRQRERLQESLRDAESLVSQVSKQLETLRGACSSWQERAAEADLARQSAQEHQADQEKQLCILQQQIAASHAEQISAIEARVHAEQQAAVAVARLEPLEAALAGAQQEAAARTAQAGEAAKRMEAAVEAAEHFQSQSLAACSQQQAADEALATMRKEAGRWQATAVRHQEAVAGVTADNVVFLMRLQRCEAELASATASRDELRLAAEEQRGPWFDEIREEVESRVSSAMQKAAHLEEQLEAAAEAHTTAVQELQQRERPLHPATLEYSPGTKVAVYVTFLTPDLLERMDATEGAYFLCELFNINLRLGISLQDFGLGKQAPESLKFIFQYNHQHGTPHFPILLDGQAAATSPIAIQEIPAADRRFPTLSQTQMQRALKYLFQNRKGNTFPALPVAHDAHHSECQEGWKEASEDDLDTWILENLDDSVKRGAIVDALTAIARPFGWESSKIMRTLGDRYAANVA